MTRRRANWGEALFSIRHSPSLSEDEKAWILGRTARKMLNWPPPEKPRKPAPLAPHRPGHKE
jgi:L-fuconolactonase